MREIEPRHVQARTDQPLEHLRRVGRRPDGRDNLGLVIRKFHTVLRQNVNVPPKGPMGFNPPHVSPFSGRTVVG